MCLPLEEQNLCSKIVNDHEQSKVAMPLLSAHEQNFSDDRCQPILTEIQREQCLESGGQSFITFVNQVKHSQKYVMLQHRGSIHRITCVVHHTSYLTVHHISLKHIVRYGGQRFSIFRKLNNKVIFNYLVTNKSYLFISLIYMSFVCDVTLQVPVTLTTI